jgi:hypothetical protein
MVFIDSPEAIVDTFDITACCLALDGTDLVYHPGALQDIQQQRISFHRRDRRSAWRARKYILKGFSLDPADRDYVISTATNAHAMIKAAEKQRDRK